MSKQWINGIGYIWPNGGRVYQESELLPDGLPIGHTDYGIPCAGEDVYLSGGQDRGTWVMGKLGSFHKLPWQSPKLAQAYMDHLMRRAITR